MFEEVIMERAKMEAETYYAALISTLNDKNEQLSLRVNYLENLLKQYNIQFD